MKKRNDVRDERSTKVGKFLRRARLEELTRWVGDEDVTTYAPRGSY